MRYFIITILIFPLLAVAQAPLLADLISDPFNESYDPEVSVSGNVIVGVMTASAAQAIVTNSLTLNTIAGDAMTQACLKVTSRDGIYSSRNEYQLPDGNFGTVVLPYSSRHSDAVEEYLPQDIAIAATTGECNSGSSEYYLVTNAKPDSSTEIFIYLNSFGATDVFFQVNSDTENRINGACEPISEGRRTTYDFRCQLPAEVGKGRTGITLLRERFGREQPAIVLQVIGSAP